MTKTPTQIFQQSKQLIPLKLFQQVFCKNCQNHCNPTETRFQNCMLAYLADELTRIRQLLQQRIQPQA